MAGILPGRRNHGHELIFRIMWIQEVVDLLKKPVSIRETGFFIRLVRGSPVFLRGVLSMTNHELLDEFCNQRPGIGEDILAK